MTANNPIAALLGAPLEPDWTVEALAERLLDAVAVRPSDDGQEIVFAVDESTDRQAARLIRPLLAYLATKSAADAGTTANLYGGRLRFKRLVSNGPVWVLGEFDNRSDNMRLMLRSSRLSVAADRGDWANRSWQESGVTAPTN